MSITDKYILKLCPLIAIKKFLKKEREHVVGAGEKEERKGNE
jgi:hypothetical protein